MKLTFWNGVDTVGGVQVLASGERGSLIFDLGVVRNPYIAPRRALFNDFVRPRPDSVLADYLRAGMAPRLEGLFDSRYGDGSTDPAVLYSALTADLPLVGTASVGRVAVYVSHLHDDHMALLPFVAPEIPVYMSETGRSLHRAMTEAGELQPVEAPITGIGVNETFEVEDLEVEVVPIDHDIIGAAGIIVRSGRATIAYTGDWRRHGTSPHVVDAFADRCREVGVDALLTEASTAGPSPRPSIGEGELVERLDKLVTAATGGLVWVSFYRRHLERVAAIAEIARGAGRKLAVSERTATLLTHVAEVGLLGSDVLSGLVVYVGQAPPSVPTVTVGEIQAARDEFLLEIEPSTWPLLLDVGVEADDVYVHVNGAPFGRTDPTWPVLETWLGQLGISHEVLDSHGHASPADLEWLADRIEPGCVIPVHTNHPTHFPGGRHRVVLPQRGGKIEVVS
ncbi:MAG TPA: MBL fold metallo-hydrolase [Acidimicrobiia bacterium]|nr:MBL fold metallo-hydrolase [Acidimicrobiia bacterium]